MGVRAEAAGGREARRRPEASGDELTRLRQALGERIEFIEDMSHELRSGLTFIKGYVDLFVSGSLGPVNERQARALEVMARRTETIVHLLEQMLSLERARAGHLEISRMVDLCELVHHSVQSAALAAKEAGVSLDVQLPPSCLGDVDPRRLIQVMDNLLSNAIKFSDDGDTVRIGLEEKPDHVVISVADEGVGMSPEDRRRIFHRFYRTRHAAGHATGSGLGLVITKAIVEAHGGSIEVESALGQGTTFRVLLPKAYNEVSEPFGER